MKHEKRFCPILDVVCHILSVCDTVDRVKWRKNFSFLFVIMFIRHAIKYGMEMSRTVEYEVIEMNFAIDYHHIECVNSQWEYGDHQNVQSLCNKENILPTSFAHFCHRCKYLVQPHFKSISNTLKDTQIGKRSSEKIHLHNLCEVCLLVRLHADAVFVHRHAVILC